MKKNVNGGNQIHSFISSSGSGTIINYGSDSGSDFLTSYGSGSGSTSQKLRFPTVPVPVPVPQRCKNAVSESKNYSIQANKKTSYVLLYQIIPSSSCQFLLQIVFPNL
jgi:hypothetical protein